MAWRVGRPLDAGRIENTRRLGYKPQQSACGQTKQDDAMLLTMMRAKLHRATVTRADLHYEGSISIDRDLMDAVGFLPNEQVDVLDIDNGARFTTYVIEAARGSKTIGINGAAARLVQPGDKVIILSYCQMSRAEAEKHQPVVALMDDHNNIKPAKA